MISIIELLCFLLFWTKFYFNTSMCRNRDGSQHHATGESSIEMSLLGNLSDTNHNVGKWAISTTINQQTKVNFFCSSNKLFYPVSTILTICWEDFKLNCKTYHIHNKVWINKNETLSKIEDSVTSTISFQSNWFSSNLKYMWNGYFDKVS